MVGLELVVLASGPDRVPGDATNYLGGVANVLQADKPTRVDSSHLQGLDEEALYEDDRQIKGGAVCDRVTRELRVTESVYESCGKIVWDHLVGEAHRHIRTIGDPFAMRNTRLVADWPRLSGDGGLARTHASPLREFSCAMEKMLGQPSRTGRSPSWTPSLGSTPMTTMPPR